MVKAKNRTFFFKSLISTSRREKIKIHHYEMKDHASKIFPTYYYDKFQKMMLKNIFHKQFSCMYEKSRNLLRELEAKNTIFFKKLKSMSKHLKNSCWQMKPTSYRYFWTSFHCGVSGFEWRNPSKIQCPEISAIWVPL